MSKFKVVFTLKQHTPIIHFQSQQSGATLRATELKPKFDRFLIAIFEKKNIDYQGFLISGQEGALDYKVKIEPNISPSQNIDERDALFFGNMGEGEDKRFKEINRPFKIEFFTFKSTLKEYINQYFEAFLANTNFGTRQSKGFGSFYIDKKQLNTNLVQYRVYSFDTRNWKRDIGLLYQFLRQGLNLPNREGTRFYSKPAIFSYAKSKGWTWDKKAIKQAYFNTTLNDQIDERSSDILMYSGDNSHLLRDLFGLSSSQEWKRPYGKTIEKTNADIERFKSPITFKIVDDKVYFWADDSVGK
ncbi:MAG: hypothetical protein U9O83_07595, partial [Campylobacterota bacterium]|nr:hypothetical protein [Campylobacterota bacterium]